MVQFGSGSKSSVSNFMLTSYSCYLIAQNRGPNKEEYEALTIAELYTRKWIVELFFK